MTDTNAWYQQLCKDILKSRTKCCNAKVLAAGTCSEGCCDRYKCAKCGKTWLQEVGD